MLDPEVSRYICGLSDADLLEYVNADPELYQSEAVAFARQEMERRGLKGERLEAVEEMVEARAAARSTEAAEAGARPLGWKRLLAPCVLTQVTELRNKNRPGVIAKAVVLQKS